MKLPILFLLLAVGLLSESRVQAEATNQGLKETISKNDANKDGLISEEELTEIFEAIQEKRQTVQGDEEVASPSTSPEEASARLMKKLDRDKDGLLTHKQVHVALMKIAKKVKSKL